MDELLAKVGVNFGTHVRRKCEGWKNEANFGDRNVWTRGEGGGEGEAA